MSSLQGQLLIAVPELADANFFRSVVLMIHHDEAGATGVILNRPSDVTVGQVWKDVSETPCDCQQVVYVGGPVEGPLIALHTLIAHSETTVFPEVYVSLSRDHLNAIVTQAEHSFQLYSGYSGWGPEQLEQEIDAGGWLILPAQSQHVFATPEELWKQVCDAFGSQVLQKQLGKHPPHDPTLN